MKVVSTFLQPSSVVASAKGSLVEGDRREHLVIAKPDRLEVFAVLPDDLKQLCFFEVWGQITSLHTVPRKGNGGERILVVTDHPEPQLLILSLQVARPESKYGLQVDQSFRLSERNGRASEIFNGAVLDNRGKAGVICSYSGKLRVVEFEAGLIKAEFDTPLRELNILSMCFLPTSNARATILSILHRNYSQQLVVSSHELSLSKSELSPGPTSYLSDILVPDDESHILIPVARTKGAWAHDGGLLIVGGQKLFFHSVDRTSKRRGSKVTGQEPSTRTAKVELDWVYAQVTAWAQMDDEGSRFILGDSRGRLILVALDDSQPRLHLFQLGQTSIATSIVPLSPQFIYVSSHFGDGKLLQFSSNRSSRANLLDVVEDYPNIAPVMDAIIADLGDGQPTIVTASGGAGSGTLRFIRNGADFIETSRLVDLESAIGLWTIRNNYADKFDSYLLVSTSITSHVLRLPEGSWGSDVKCSSDLSALKLNLPTMALGNMLSRESTSDKRSIYKEGSDVVQVTSTGILVSDIQNGVNRDEWTPGREEQITNADLSPSQICIALAGGQVLLFNILDGLLNKQRYTTFFDSSGETETVSALTLHVQGKNSKFSETLILGFWTTNSVKVASVPDLEVKHTIQLDGLPRSLLLHDFEGESSDAHTFLIVGMANGCVSMIPFNNGPISNARSVPLGDWPVTLDRCDVNGRSVVFASGMRSVILFWMRDALNHSAVLIKDISAMCNFSTSCYASSIALSTSAGIIVGKFSDREKKHVRMVPFGDDIPIKVAFDAENKLIGVGCTRRSPVPNDAIDMRSRFKFLSTENYAIKNEIALEVEEEITSLTTLRDGIEKEPSEGKIRIIFASCERGIQPHIAVEHATTGAVKSLEDFHGRLAAAIDSEVNVFGLSSPTENARINEITRWNHNYDVTEIKTFNEYLAVSDIFSSLALLKLEGTKLVTVVKCFSPLYPLCFNVMDQQTLLGANVDNNLFSYEARANTRGMTLEQNGFFNYSETVNKIVRYGGQPHQDVRGVRSKHLIFSASGRVSMVVDVDEDISKRLHALERNLSHVLKGPGDIEHDSWRAPSNQRGRSDAHETAVGFIDGDFVDRFLDLEDSSPEFQAVLAGSNEAERLEWSREELRSTLESLRHLL